MKILGYGEDALTLWVLSKRLDEFLKLLRDETPVDEAFVLYRPSFGRRGSGGHDSKRRAEFGEFDAIVAGKRDVYLIESKWSGSSELRDDGSLVLRDQQVRRHEVFQSYLSLWRELAPQTWEEFYRGAAVRFEKTHTSVKFAPTDSLLRQNLEFVLRSLTGRVGAIRNVVLLVRFERGLAVPRICPDASRKDRADFDCVVIECDGVGGGFYVELAADAAQRIAAVDEVPTARNN